MKRRLKADAYAKLSAEFKTHYEERDGFYFLKVEKDEDDDSDDDNDERDSAATRAKNREKEARKAAEKRAREAEEKLAAIEAAKEQEADEALRKKGDPDALAKSYDAKQRKIEKEAAEKVERAYAALKKQTADRAAVELAAELTDHPVLLMPHIKSRISVDIDENGDPQLRVLDRDGQPSASTLADLKKDLQSKEYAAIIRGNQSSGGANGVKQTVKRSPLTSGSGGESKKLADMKPEEAKTHLQELHAQRFGSR